MPKEQIICVCVYIYIYCSYTIFSSMTCYIQGKNFFFFLMKVFFGKHTFDLIFLNSFQELNQFLADRVYILGHFVSLADMLLYFTLHETFVSIEFFIMFLMKTLEK